MKEKSGENYKKSGYYCIAFQKWAVAKLEPFFKVVVRYPKKRGLGTTKLVNDS